MPKLGIMSKFYLNMGTTAAPNFVELPLISDCTVNAPWDKADASTRETRVKQSENPQMDIEVTGKIRVKKAKDNIAYLKMFQMHYAGDKGEFLVLNGAKEEDGSEGFIFWGKIFNWSEDQSLGAVLYKDFSIGPCIWDEQDQKPRAVRVIGANMTFYEIGTAE